MAVHCVRRASSGCIEEMAEVCVTGADLWASRRVSCRPGAEGAPWLGVVVVGRCAAGVILRDWRCWC